MTRLIAIAVLLATAAGCEQAFWPNAADCHVACAPRPVRSLIKGACVCDTAQPDGGR